MKKMNYIIVYFVLMISITYRIAKVSRFINDIKKQMKGIDYAVVKDYDPFKDPHLKIHKSENLMLHQLLSFR